MHEGAVAAFWVVALLLIVAPGPDWAFTLGATVRGNALLPAVGGLVTGYAVMTLVVAAGVGEVVAGTPAALTGLCVLGGGYLVWLGASTLRHPAAPPVAAGSGPARTDRRTFAQGVGVSGLNPKGLLIYVALLPQFTDPRGPWPLRSQLLLLGAVFTLTCAVFYLGLAAFARTVLAPRPAAARALGRLSGAAMVLIGLVVVVERAAA